MDPLDPLGAPDGDDEDLVVDDDDDEGEPPKFYLTTFLPRSAWYELDAGDATTFLQNRVAQLNEAFVGEDEGVIWAYRYHVQERAREVDAVVLLWMITSDVALETLEATLRRSDVNRYFDWSVIGGPQNNAPQDILGAFLGTLVPDADGGYAEGMQQRSDDQPNPERETAFNDPESGKRVADTNATPSPHGGATAEGGALDTTDETPPKE